MSHSKSEILLLVTGSIAAYKACHLVSRLVQSGHGVQVVATPSALQFVGAATWEGLSGRPVVSDLWERGHAMDHIHLIRKADVVIAAPASAHFINRIATGIGDDLMTTMFLAHDFKKPFLVAPAMNTAMYMNPVTQNSLKRLREMGLDILESASGVLACGETGFGKLLEPDLILKDIERALNTGEKSAGRAAATSKEPRRKILITAGGTREKIDDVREITNSSTGRSGARLADTLSGLGFDVILLKAKSAVRPADANLTVDEFVSFADLESRLQAHLSDGSVTHVIHMAAVSDYTVDRVLVNGEPFGGGKTPSGARLSLELKATPKLISRLKDWSPNKSLKVAGFKLTSHASNESRDAAAKIVLENADVVLGNDLSEIRDEYGAHPYVLYSKTQREALGGFGQMSARLASWAAEEHA